MRITACLFVTRVDHSFSRSSMSEFEHYERIRLCRYLKMDFNKTTDKIVIYAFFFVFFLVSNHRWRGSSGGMTDIRALWEGRGGGELVKSKNVFYAGRAKRFTGLDNNFVSVPTVRRPPVNSTIVWWTASGNSVDATQELYCLGVCNLLGSFVSSMPVTGSFSRSAVNHASGVRTPMGGMYTGKCPRA